MRRRGAPILRAPPWRPPAPATPPVGRRPGRDGDCRPGRPTHRTPPRVAPPAVQQPGRCHRRSASSQEEADRREDGSRNRRWGISGCLAPSRPARRPERRIVGAGVVGEGVVGSRRQHGTSIPLVGTRNGPGPRPAGVRRGGQQVVVEQRIEGRSGPRDVVRPLGRDRRGRHRGPCRAGVVGRRRTVVAGGEHRVGHATTNARPPHSCSGSTVAWAATRSSRCGCRGPRVRAGGSATGPCPVGVSATPTGSPTGHLGPLRRRALGVPCRPWGFGSGPRTSTGPSCPHHGRVRGG